MIKRILSILFGWETVYLTSNIDEYARIRGRLIDNGVKTKIKITNNSSSSVGRSMMAISSNIGENYEIFVRKEDVHKATQIIYSHR
ncbi:hypothetical protein [Desulfosporosinus sp. OT]|uniref:hypothetical protein n=1 Tax=Desulfosporosinus sp. OT TaxID=913865 RepID=UPI000223B088|nr:hypothetical protein [Desulfosporosinus sp. OT]EGW39458.1 hypothetical protein DOT_2511 [Desulfosporosinus sp. OT]